MMRDIYCGEIRESDIGKRVRVCGWCARQRDLGSLIFIDLRDRTGIVQLAFDEKTDRKIFDDAFGVRAEFVLAAGGIVRSRGAGALNDNIPTGHIEIAVDEFKIVTAAKTPPFEITENSDVREDLRLKYRYLDLRRPDIQKNIIARHKIVKIARDYFSENGFLEIETPVLIKSTPEGARDYLVPSRVHKGSFYALPQSPQLYKQLLMLSGFDRYMQVARCFRDEDLRADRQPEFTQLDLEMSFVDEEDVMSINEGFIKYLFLHYFNKEIETPFPRITWKEAMERYGSDKPDTRFGFELNDISGLVKNCGFKVFSGAVENGGSVRAINVKGGGKFSRKEIDALAEFAKQYKAKGLAWAKNNEGEISSSYAKFLTEEENNAVYNALGFEKNDLILIVADKNRVVFDTLGALRVKCAEKLNLLDPKEFNFLWVVYFPMFEYSEEDGRYYAMHHPFTAPCEEDIEFLETDPGRVRARAYDIVLNGTEAGGGSVRIHSRDTQEKVFRAMGMEKEVYEEKFGFLLEAFKYGAPPHAGLAFGLDRLCALMLGLDAIRDVIAFPKVQNASELMTECPAEVPEEALRDLGIEVSEKESK